MLVTDMLDPYNLRGPKPKLFAAIFAGVAFRTTLFNPMHISSVTLHDPLPSGMSINNHGIMSGYVESVDGNMEEHRILLSVTDLEGNTSDGDLQINILKLMPYHTRASYDVNAVVPYELNSNTCDEFVQNPCTANQDCSLFSCPAGMCQCDTKGELCFCST
jgi:hypothetical protein